MTLRRRALWLLGCAGLAAFLAWALVPKPDLYEGVGFSTLVTDRYGQWLRLLPANDGRYRLFTPLERVAPAAQEAVLLYEDRRFYRHPGVDPIALARAAWTTYVRRSRMVGGSTITMQLARLHFGLDTRSPLGKLVQAARALQLERHYTKAEILEAYLNLAPYGGSVEGIGTASLIYFDKPARSLSRGEALALAVIPQNPTARFPATDAGRARLLAARARLLTAWHAANPALGADEETLARARLEPVFRAPADLPARARHFVRDHVVRSGAAEVRTTLDLDLQTVLETRIRDYIDRRHRDGIHNAAAMLLDHRQMEVRALVGSADFFDATNAGQVNGVRARRSPGSALKPLLYALALDDGLIHPMTLLADAPHRYAAYTPENFDRGFLGPIFARDALIHSRNLPAVDLLAKLGVPRFRDWLHNAGVDRLRLAEEYGLSLALGGSEITMEELVRLYAILAGGGIRRDLATVQRAAPASPPKRLLSAESSYLVLDILRDVPRPDAPALPTASRPAVAWKTGTSFGFRDAWSIGVVGRYVLAVWVGNFDGSANPALVGREAAAPLFFTIVNSLGDGAIPQTQLHRRSDWAGGVKAPPRGLNLRRVEVCATTGDLPGPYCPHTTRSWFIPGVSPIKVSSVYRAIRVDPTTGLRSCHPDAAGTRQEVYEFWPSDIALVFRRAGIAIRRPPPWSPECGLDATSASGYPPRIRSPQSTLVYHAPWDGDERGGVPFSAAADGDAQELFWFVNDRFVGRVTSDEAYFWRPRPGQFEVRVVDDLGRAASVQITVNRPALPIGRRRP